MNFTLSNGVEIPSVGFGPMIMGYGQKPRPSLPRWNLLGRMYRKCLVKPFEHSQYIRAIADGICAGFRLIDYSSSYGSGEDIGEAIEKSGVHRDQLFLTGRIGNAYQFEGPEAVRRKINKILSAYRTDRLDLLMFHWPVPGKYMDTWKVFEEAYRAGIARSIGVANCHKHHLEALQDAEIMPMVNQIEVHPLFSQNDLVSYCQAKGILVEAYTPIARGDDRLFRLPALHAIARAHKKTPAQIVLRWHVQRGLLPVIRSMNPARQKEDLGIYDFELTVEDMRTIASFNINSRLRYDPDNVDFTIV